jgi:hypothetical protein
MSPSVSEYHALTALTLEEELSRARELEATGKEHLDAQETRVARRNAKNMHNLPSERLLGLMHETHRLQASHVKLLEREIRELSGETKG